MESVFFLGASTPKGFVSHYDSLFREVQRLTIIKGGPGCGKSTFMKKIGAAAQEHGLDVSYILCSSDPDSLDGILLPQLEAAYVDGTAPHVLEPKLCGGSMNYLSFGEFYDRAAMQSNEAEILSCQKENAVCYRHVTACLAAADALSESTRLVTSAPHYGEEMSAIAECLGLSALKPVGDRPKRSERFLSAITPKGLRFCEQTPQKLCERVYVLRDNYSLAPKVLSLLSEKAQALGHTCIVCHSPLHPQGEPTHLLIPTAGVAFVSDSRDFPYTESCFCKIDLDSALSPKSRKQLEFCGKTVTSLLYHAVSHLREAKRLHDRMEQLCRPFVDFSAVDRLTEKTVSELFGASPLK